VPFPRFPQPGFRPVQLPGGPLDDLVVGMTAEPVGHCLPHESDLLGRAGGIGAEHDLATFARLVHVRTHTRFEGPGLPEAPALLRSVREG
jgi:hypothetical protein